MGTCREQQDLSACLSGTDTTDGVRAHREVCLGLGELPRGRCGLVRVCCSRSMGTLREPPTTAWLGCMNSSRC